MMQTTIAGSATSTHLAREHPTAPDASDVLRLALLRALEDRPGGFLLLDAGSRVLHATARAGELLGLSAEHDFRDAALPELFARFAAESVPFADAFAGREEGAPAVVLRGVDPQCILHLRVRDLGFGYRAAVLELPPPPGDGDAGLIAVAHSDHVTGLASRASFEQAAKAALARPAAGPAAILMLDLDRFKAVNDTLGHAAGDELLRLVSERLQVAVRRTDVVSRFGGDEFAILLEAVDGPEHAAAVAARILDLVQRSYLIEGQLANVGVSVGIAFAPDHGTDSAGLIQAADLALYDAKESGRAAFRFYDPGMKQRAQGRRESELDLRRALALRQLELHYQPQTTVRGHLIGFEALLRWRHPTRGLVPPAEFIPLAERIGAIVPIGDWVLRTGAKEALKWPEDISLAVNVSPLQVESANFVERVERILATTGLPSRRLEIEITESMIINGGEKAVNVLNDLRDLGARVVMDDFGTGYASLSQLARFPFDKIKIDKSLTGAEGEDDKKRAIVRAIAALGRSLGVCTLAEGVEGDGQLSDLESDGCASVQGYLFGKPAPASELGDLITRLHVPPTPAKAHPLGDDGAHARSFSGMDALGSDEGQIS